MPRQGIDKRFQAGNWQVSQAGTANVPRQGTGKCPQAGTVDVPRQGTVVVPRQGTVDIAKEHSAKKFSNDLPPTPEVPLHRQPAVCCVMSLHASLQDEGLC